MLHATPCEGSTWPQGPLLCLASDQRNAQLESFGAWGMQASRAYSNSPHPHPILPPFSQAISVSNMFENSFWGKCRRAIYSHVFKYLKLLFVNDADLCMACLWPCTCPCSLVPDLLLFAHLGGEHLTKFLLILEELHTRAAFDGVPIHEIV